MRETWGIGSGRDDSVELADKVLDTEKVVNFDSSAVQSKAGLYRN